MKKKTLERDSRLRHTPVPGTKHNNYEENNRGYNSRNCKESKNGADKCMQKSKTMFGAEIHLPH